MASSKSQESAETEPKIQEAINGSHLGIYKSRNQAARWLNAPHSTLHDQISGQQTHTISHEDQQAFTPEEESELVQWITTLSASAYAPLHSIVYSMAEEIQ